MLGVDVQRIRRSLGLRSEPTGQVREDAPEERPALTREQIRRFEQHIRRELERMQIERTQALPPSRPLNELDRALPSGPLQDLAAVHRVVMQLKRRLATQGHETRGHKRHAHVDVRRTMRGRAIGGVFAELAEKFRAFVDVLAEIRDSGRASDALDVLRLYEVWLKTGSLRAARLLRSQGIEPNASLDAATRH